VIGVDFDGSTRWGSTINLSVDHAGQLWQRFPGEDNWNRRNQLLGYLADVAVDESLEPELEALREAWAAAYDRGAEERALRWDFLASR
jgi:hypothetical protein